MQHIVVISTSYPITANGQEAAGNFVADFVSQLSCHAKVTVLAPAKSKNSVFVNDNLKVEYFAVPELPLSTLKITHPKSWFSILFTLINGNRALGSLIGREKVDFIFALWVLPSGYWARNFAKKRNIPYATWALGSDIWSLSHLPLISRVLRRVLKDSSINFADGYQLAADVKKLSNRECHFLPSTRQLTEIPFKKLAIEPPYTLVFLGRWHPNKGIDILLESLLSLDNADWKRIRKVRIAGGGPLALEVMSALKLLKAEGRPVEVLGYLDKDEATKFLTAADYVLIPSRIESIPVIFSDAMKCRSPVIAMPVGDLPALLEQFGVGLLSKDVTSASFALAIRNALNKSCQEFDLGLQRGSDIFDVHKITAKFKSFIIHLSEKNKYY